MLRFLALAMSLMGSPEECEAEKCASVLYAGLLYVSVYVGAHNVHAQVCTLDYTHTDIHYQCIDYAN